MPRAGGEAWEEAGQQQPTEKTCMLTKPGGCIFVPDSDLDSAGCVAWPAVIDKAATQLPKSCRENVKLALL